MLSLARMSVRRNIGVLVIVLAILVGGTGAAVKVATDHLLYQNATAAASGWARYLADNVSDLEEIARGERPSAASMAFLQGARKAGQVFRYTIFNREGYSQLVSDQDKIALVDFSEYSADAARSIATAQPVVAVKEGQAPDFPLFTRRLTSQLSSTIDPLPLSPLTSTKRSSATIFTARS
jgi:hypothetical protein